MLSLNVHEHIAAAIVGGFARGESSVKETLDTVHGETDINEKAKKTVINCSN